MILTEKDVDENATEIETGMNDGEVDQEAGRVIEEAVAEGTGQDLEIGIGTPNHTGDLDQGIENEEGAQDLIQEKEGNKCLMSNGLNQ